MLIKTVNNKNASDFEQINNKLDSLNLEFNNINKDISKYRDSFIKSESIFVKELLLDDDFIKLIIMLNKVNSTELYKQAIQMSELIEQGLISDNELKRAKKKIVALLISIYDDKTNVNKRFR